MTTQQFEALKLYLVDARHPKVRVSQCFYLETVAFFMLPLEIEN